jgi:hypothetical protein
MTILAIEINDVGLRAACLDASGAPAPLGPPSPGYALLGRSRQGTGSLVLGEPARGAARLDPRFVSHRHWDRMSLEPVGRPFPAALRQADLVHAHLAAYWAGLQDALADPSPAASVLLAVPGGWSSEQLGLLLGVARSVGMPVTGMVDAGLVATERLANPEAGGLRGPATGRTLHVDVLLHRAVLTLLETAGPTRRRLDVAEIDGAGRLAFERRWVESIARRFVRETRFDPLYRADSEQALHDRLPDCNARLAAHPESAQGARAVLALDAERSIEVEREAIVSAGCEPIESIAGAAADLAGGGPLTPALSARAARLLGLGAALAAACGSSPLALPDGAAAAGALRHRSDIESPGERLPLVVELPVVPARVAAGTAAGALTGAHV